MQASPLTFYSSFYDYSSIFTLGLAAMLLACKDCIIRLSPICERARGAAKSQPHPHELKSRVSTHGRSLRDPILCLSIVISNCAQEQSYFGCFDLLSSDGIIFHNCKDVST